MSDELFLEPTELTFERTPGGQLRLHLPDRCVRPVQVVRAFPLSRPEEYLSVRSGDEEIGLLRSLDALSGEQRRLVAEDLDRRYFLPVIRQVKELGEGGGSFTWETVTDRGPATFSTQHPRHCATLLDDGRWLIVDQDKNRYLIDAPQRLEKRTRNLLAVFLG